MAKNRLSSADISYRPARPSDAVMAGKLLYETFPKKAAFIIGLGSTERAKKVLETIFPIPGHRLSYQFTDLVLHQGRVIGLVTSFHGKAMGKLNRKLNRIVLGQYRLRGKLALILRAWPLVFIEEATSKDYFINSLSIRKNYRNRGVGALVLNHAAEKAKGAGLNKMALMVAIDNQDARRFYENHGFKTTALHLESNKRVPYLGPGVHRMVKILTK